MENFVAILIRTGHDATAAAMEAESRCQPKRGAARYAVPKIYKPPEKMAPVIRCVDDRIHGICGL